MIKLPGFCCIAAIITLLLFLTGCVDSFHERGESAQESAAVELLVSAASSMSAALEEVKAEFAQYKDHKVKVIVNYASSGTLQKQIEQGAPIDLYLSASREHMERLIETGLVDKEGVVNLLGNEMVLIVPSRTAFPIEGFADLQREEITRIAIGVPETVPAGRYAKETLVNLGLWNQVQDKLVPAKDVRQVLAYVETGNVDAGIAYRSDVAVAANVKVVAAADKNMHSPIIYPAAVIKNSKHREEAEEFLRFLQSDEARSIFSKYGFQMAFSTS